MNTGRLEAFSDGVLAIIITIMVLEFKVPHDITLTALLPLWPKFLSYVLSFVYVGIYWNNHHHMFQAAQKVNGPILWANSHLLFWLSLIPFTSAWMGEHQFSQWPVFLYGCNLVLCAFAYTLLEKMLVNHNGKNSTLGHAVDGAKKGNISLALYVAGVAMSFFDSRISFAFYAAVAVMWLVPDRRIEKEMLSEERAAGR